MAAADAEAAAADAAAAETAAVSDAAAAQDMKKAISSMSINADVFTEFATAMAPTEGYCTTCFDAPCSCEAKA